MTNPKDFEQLRTLVAQIEARLSHLETSPFDLKSRQITNLPLAILPKDAVPLGQLQGLIAQIKTATQVNNFTGSGTQATQIGLAYNSANQSIPNSSPTPLTFNVNVRDTGIHSTSVNPTQFLIPSDGLYLCYSQVQWTAAAAATMRTSYIYVNGALVAPAHLDVRLPTSITGTTGMVFGILLLSAADVITFPVLQDSGGALNVIGNFSIGGVWKVGV